MFAKFALRSEKYPAIIGLLTVSVSQIGNCLAAVNDSNSIVRFINNKFRNKGPSRPLKTLMTKFLASFLVILFGCVFQSHAIAGSKLIDDVKFNDTRKNTFSLYFDEELNQLQVNGIMDIGILPAFKRMLLKHPQLTAVVFNSNGGNIYQARGLAKVIISNALNTYVAEDCYSACTIAYMAGKVRSMSPNGRLGFHQYNMQLKLLNHRFDIEKEQAKDLSFFKTRIDDNEFIEKIFTAKNSDLWIPKQKVLLKTGVIHEIVPQLER